MAWLTAGLAVPQSMPQCTPSVPSQQSGNSGMASWQPGISMPGISTDCPCDIASSCADSMADHVAALATG